MDLSIGEIILLAVVIWIVSQVLLGIMDAFAIVKLTERVKLLKHLKDVIHQVKVENVNGVEYWYDEGSHTFLGQGRSVDEVIAVLKARFPDHVFLLEGRGGVAAQTDWKLMDPDEFRQHVNLNKKEST